MSKIHLTLNFIFNLEVRWTFGFRPCLKAGLEVVVENHLKTVNLMEMYCKSMKLLCHIKSALSNMFYTRVKRIGKSEYRLSFNMLYGK